MTKRKTVKERNLELKPLGKQLKHFGIILCILPNEKQIVKSGQTFGCSRFIYNDYLATRSEYYKETGETLSVNAYKKDYLNPNKKTEEFSFLSEVDKFALESAVENVQDAFDRFFKGQNRFPKFKTKRKAKKAYTTKFTNNNINCIQIDKYYYEVSNVYKKTLGCIVDTLKMFKNMTKSLLMPDLNDKFNKALYSTYLTYLDEDNLSYSLDKKEDNRGYLAEVIKSPHFGQIFI